MGRCFGLRKNSLPMNKELHAEAFDQAVIYRLCGEVGMVSLNTDEPYIVSIAMDTTTKR
jgi:hypothetical protein